MKKKPETHDLFKHAPDDVKKLHAQSKREARLKARKEWKERNP